MNHPTMKEINRQLALYGIELVKGEGYFYFWALNTRTAKILNNLESTSVWVYRLNEHTVEEWVEEGKNMLKEGRGE